MKQLFLILFSCILLTVNAQDWNIPKVGDGGWEVEQEFTLNKKRRNILLISEASAYTVALVGLNQLWYAAYDKSDFHFINDNRRFTAKRNEAVWRGAGKNSEARQYFVKNYHDIPIFDIGQTGSVVDKPWFKSFMSIYQQLAYKFIFCIEGVDTATSIKWVMSSNSVCVMPKPKYETWFMEGLLVADVHYIIIKDDYTDLEQRLNYYINNQDKALQIIENANAYVQQFKNQENETLISLLTLKKYFEKTNQTCA